MINFQCSKAEYEIIQAHCRKTTCRSFSEYARKVLMAKPVAVTCRDLGLDQLIDLVTGLRNQLERIIELKFSKGDAAEIGAMMQELKIIIPKIANECIRKYG